MRQLLKDVNLRIRAKIADLRLPDLSGTIITGSPRSGTTLALRVYCPGLTADEESDGSLLNEYRPLSYQVIRGNIQKALRILPLVMQNRAHLHKAPHLAFLLPYVRPKYRLIITFRDLRLTVPSMLRHENVRRMVLSDNPFWLQYTKRELPDDVVSRAAIAAEEYYLSALRYRGPIQLWNYGFWNEWTIRNRETVHLYARAPETSARVVLDIREGMLFSDKSFSLQVWDAFCRSHEITLKQRRLICNANECIREHYARRGLALKTLDD